ncbi:MAG: hypothetical protein ACTS3F_06490 [Phycisphaerales bacterium]
MTRNHSIVTTTATAIAALAALTTAAHAGTPLFQPDSATAGSEFNSSYDIGNTTNGSGLEPDFCPGSPHATYVQHNHWTTKSNALPAGTAFANFFFDNDTTIGTLLLWNHRSNGVASDPGYAVTVFDLRYYDADDQVIEEFIGLEATPNVLTAQAYRVGPIDGVRRVEFVIVENNGSQYTGFAEIAFSAERFCTGDLNNDGLVNSDDLGLLLGAFGTGPAGDLNCDDLTDSDDLGILLSTFGTTCD